MQIKVSHKKKVCSRFKIIVLLYIAHFLKKEVTGSPSEVCKFEKKKVFSPKFASWVGKIKKKIHPAGGSETTVFFTLALLPASRGSNVMTFTPS